MRHYLRTLLRLRPYSDDFGERHTARQELSVRLAMAQPAAQRVLDVGCASGWFELLCAGRLASDLFGIDVGTAMLEQAKRNAPHARYTAGSVLALPFADAEFDGAVMFEVIEHVPKDAEAQALREVRRVLKPGSWLLLSTPFAHPVSATLDPAWYFGHRHYSRKRITALMEAAGFRTDASMVRGGLWELGGIIALYAFKWLLGAEAPLKELFERHRTGEFLSGQEGISNIFVQAVAV
jgi:SAM-dependent methyltransferase